MQTSLYIVSVLMTITIYFVCALSGSADICKAFAEFLMISSNVISQTRDFLSGFLMEGHYAFASRSVGRPGVQRQQLNRDRQRVQ